MQGTLKACVALSALLATAAGATVADAATPPRPCTTASLITDPAGDASATPLPVTVNAAKQPAPDNMDLTGFYLTTDSFGTAAVNIRLKDASLAMPSRSVSLSGISLYFVYRNIDGVQRFVSADIKQDPLTGDVDPTATDGSITYDQGYVDTTNGLYTSESSAGGNFYPGKAGVASITLPDVFATDTITDAMAFSYGRTDLVAVSSLPQADAAPDGSNKATAGSGIRKYSVPTCSSTTAVRTSAKSSKASKRQSRLSARRT